MTAVVVWISAYVTNNLFLCLPAWGLTICMTGRNAERERERANNVQLCCAFLVFEQFSAPAPLLWGTREIKSEKGESQGHILFQTCQVTLFFFLSIREHPPAILLEMYSISWSCSLEFINTTEIQFPL